MRSQIQRRGRGRGGALAWLGRLGAGGEEADPGAEAAVERHRHRGSRSCSLLGRRRLSCGLAMVREGPWRRAIRCDLSPVEIGPYRVSGLFFGNSTKRPSPGAKTGIRLTAGLT
jgi:hypothetical protein